MSLKKIRALGAVLLAAPATVYSQDGIPSRDATVSDEGRSPKMLAAIRAVEKRFEDAPQVGEELPDLTLYDPEGKKVRLHEALTGHYTALILGCLT